MLANMIDFIVFLEHHTTLITSAAALFPSPVVGLSKKESLDLQPAGL
jgi:hypothetical protein